MNHFIVKCKKCKTVMNQCRCASPYKNLSWSVCTGCKDIVVVPKMLIKDIKRQCRILGDKLLYPGNQLSHIIERLEACESALRQVYGKAETCANEDAHNYLEEHGWEKS